MKESIWLIGAGYMAREYAKVLKALRSDFIVIGRGEKPAFDFEKDLEVPVIPGGIDKYLQSNRRLPEHAIVAVNTEYSCEVTKRLVNFGIATILLEKPGALNVDDLRDLQKLSMENNSEVFVAYNRRFYSSVLKTKEIMKEDGGCLSFTFEFTEWSHIVRDLKKPEEVKKRWVVANSSHVIDLAFYLGGDPKYIECYASRGLDWHPSSSIFSGAGITHINALFSYHANWEAPGRWGVEVLTKRHRLILRPLEELQVQNVGSIVVKKVDLDDKLDKQFKPGLYRQTKSFLDGTYEDLKPLEHQVNDMQLYYRIARY